MGIDFTPLLTLPRKEKLALVKLLVESMESEENPDEQMALSPEVIKKMDALLQRIAAGEIRFYPWSEARERLYKLANG